MFLLFACKSESFPIKHKNIFLNKLLTSKTKYSINILKQRNTQFMEGKNMLTKFGKELRKIRIENDEILKNMADKLNVTAAYLSAVENGNRKVPDSWINIISSEYNLSDEEATYLQKLAYEDRSDISVVFDNANNQETNLALSFARKFKDLNNSQIKEIQKILDDTK